MADNGNKKKPESSGSNPRLSGRSGNSKTSNRRKRSSSQPSSSSAKKSSKKNGGNYSERKNPRRKTSHSKASEKKLLRTVLTWVIGALLCAVMLVGACIEKGVFSLAQLQHFFDLEVFGSDSVISTASDADFEFAVYYLDIGQGDSEVIISGNTSVLIDAGESDQGTKVLNTLRSLGIEKLDYIIATHPHSDHIGGLAKVINGIDAEKIIVPKVPDSLTPTSAAYERFLTAVKDSGNKLTQAKAGDIYQLGAGASLEILAPVGSEYEDLNDYSVVCRAVYKDTSFLFTGDAEKTSESDILSSGRELFSDVLKVGHHGSSTSSSASFLKKVCPSVCIISCGAGNSYGHPHEKAVKRLETYTDKIYRTDLCGNIAVYSDGEKLYIKTDKN